MSRSRPAVLVIAGTDSSGGAGLIRDVQVLTDFGVDALCAVTAVTAQSDSQVREVHHVPADLIRAQIIAAFATRAIAAVKIGMLGTRASVEAIVESLPSVAAVPIVLDPVLRSSSGGALLDAEGLRVMRQELIRRVTLVTPNIPEAALLLEEAPASDELAARGQALRLLAMGSQAVLLKGGHATGDEAVDFLATPPDSVQWIASPRIKATCRGTGCSLAAAIAAGLASGLSLVDACTRAKQYVQGMLAEVMRCSPSRE
jgi:hydroxymethylpyrimidine/phosphomethylpyrimidine kinase